MGENFKPMPTEQPEFVPETKVEKERNSEGLSKETVKKEALDVKWYSRFREAGAFSDIEFFEGNPDNRSQQKADFLEGKIDNPKFDYPDAKPEVLQQKEDSLLRLKEEIIDQEPNEVVRQAYRWKINEKVAELRMLQATASGDMRRFKRYADFIYGKPSQDVFSYVVDLARSDTDRFMSSADPQEKKAAEDVQAILPQNLERAVAFTPPEQSDVDTLREFTEKKMGNLIALTGGGEEELNREQIGQAFEEAFKVVGADNWQVVIDTGSRVTMAVNQAQEKVFIPTKIPISKPAKDMAKLLIHEIGTHVARRIKGERSKLMLLGLGLDRFIAGEEGVTGAMEQAMDNYVDPFDVDMKYILGIGLAQGLDGRKRDFRGVFEVLKKQWTMREMAQGKKLPEAEKAAEQTAYNTCTRIFRGTDCKTPGACYPKDMGYREGTLNTWEVIRTNPDEMQRFCVGKYDPHNARHLWVLDQLEINDEDLTKLEK
mgnify:CR=1 FL=1